MALSVIILAAGRGTRMHSLQPKVLQLLAGKPLLRHVLDTVVNLNPSQTLIVSGYRAQDLHTACPEKHLSWVLQEPQLGTGHAVQAAYPQLQKNTRVLVLYGDVPLIGATTLKNLLEQTPEDALGILTAKLEQPYGFGRIVRDSNGQIKQIVEEKDASSQQRQISEINTGIYVLPAKHLEKWLGALQPHNKQQEYYLTDLVAMAVADKVAIHSCVLENNLEALGVNSQQQLAKLERDYQMLKVNQLMEQGVKIYDPARVDIRGTLTVSQDVTIDVNVVFEGQVTLGSNVKIGPNVVIKDSVIGDNSQIEAYSLLDGAVIAQGCSVGPFARIRPGTQLQDQAKIGNFVETKNAIIGTNSKANHLSYIGDAEIGANVNVGAGVITCNYDGARKHKTIIEDDVFIGSNCELIAPVKIGKGATLAAGTTLTKDAPAGDLTLTKKILANISSWQRPRKNTEDH